MPKTLDIPTARAFKPLLAPAPFKGAHGGRGSGKSHFFAENLVEYCLLHPGLRAVSIREVQRSLKFSSKQLIEDKIAAFDLGPAFRVMHDQIRTPGDGIVIFTGVHDQTAQSIKSLEGFDVFWIDEAQDISKRSLEVLLPTIRKTPRSRIEPELWASWNPREPTDPIDALLRGPNKPPGALVVEVNWNDNPWFPAQQRALKEYAYRVDADAAAHVWGGAYQMRSEAQILAGKWRVDEFEPREDWEGPYQGADWGFSRHPTTLVRLWVHADTLYVEHEAYGIGVDVGPSTARLFDGVPFAKDFTTRADSARPETISAMSNLGWPVVAAPKWAGSVEDGISHLRSYAEIVIHPRCRHAIEEARLWSYKVDKYSGDVLRDPVKQHDHIWDAVRYALAPRIRKRTWGPAE